MGVELKSKLTVKVLGNPKRLLGLPDSVQRLHLGDLLGTATGVARKSDAKGDVFEALEGVFEGISAESGEVYRSGLLYLPGGFQEAIASELKRDSTSAVSFAYQVFVERSTNAIGYSYAMRPGDMGESAKDPFAAQRAALTALAPKSNQLTFEEAPKGEDKVEHTQGKEKAKGK
jgi:hypothetical protein